MDLNKFFDDLQKLLADFAADSQAAWAEKFADIGRLLDDIQPVVPPQAMPELANLKRAMFTTANPTARDWAGFFQALAAFAAKLLPLIIPLFTKTE